MGCPTRCLAQSCLTSILTKLGLTRRCRIDRLKAQSLRREPTHVNKETRQAPSRRVAPQDNMTTDYMTTVDARCRLPWLILFSLGVNCAINLL